MQTIIGLGKAGCSIAKILSKNPEYKVLYIDEGLESSSDSFCLMPQKTPEDYEKHIPKGINKFLKGVSTSTLFITSCGNISGASLAILEKIKSKTKIEIMYIIPNMKFLSKEEKLMNNILMGVFQEYTLSGLFERIFLIDNSKITSIIGNISLVNYWDTVNNYIAEIFHLWNVFEHSEPILSTKTEQEETRCPIETLAIYDINKKELACFRDLTDPKRSCYTVGVPTRTAREDITFYNNFDNGLEKFFNKTSKTVSYKFFSTNYEKEICIVKISTTKTQIAS